MVVVQLPRKLATRCPTSWPTRCPTRPASSSRVSSATWFWRRWLSWSASLSSRRSAMTSPKRFPILSVRRSAKRLSMTTALRCLYILFWGVEHRCFSFRSRSKFLSFFAKGHGSMTNPSFFREDRLPYMMDFKIISFLLLQVFRKEGEKRRRKTGTASRAIKEKDWPNIFPREAERSTATTNKKRFRLSSPETLRWSLPDLAKDCLCVVIYLKYKTLRLISISHIVQQGWHCLFILQWGFMRTMSFSDKTMQNMIGRTVAVSLYQLQLMPTSNATSHIVGGSSF